jgi:hypothetical protein
MWHLILNLVRLLNIIFRKFILKTFRQKHNAKKTDVFACLWNALNNYIYSHFYLPASCCGILQKQYTIGFQWWKYYSVHLFFFYTLLYSLVSSLIDLSLNSIQQDSVIILWCLVKIKSPQEILIFICISLFSNKYLLSRQDFLPFGFDIHFYKQCLYRTIIEHQFEIFKSSSCYLEAGFQLTNSIHLVSVDMNQMSQHKNRSIRKWNSFQESISLFVLALIWKAF